ncbi:MAG TPA: response regulator [Symbiobacteriaceae bacterium]|nr:response regulator [Symbiobacteriaceae bacterium]
MGIPLRILNVEDSQDDALLLARHLARAGYDVAFERVDTPEALQQALDRSTWDVVVADYMLPGFSAPAAVALLKQRPDHPPVVIVSGAVCDEIMGMEALQSGARDYLAKTYLSRLIPAIGLAGGVIAEADRPAAHLTLCQEYMQLPEPSLPKAVFHGEQALAGAEAQNRPEIYALAALCLGTCYVRMGWAADAVKVLHRYLAGPRQSAVLEGEIRLQLGLALRQLGDRGAASEELGKAQEWFLRADMDARAQEAAFQLAQVGEAEPLADQADAAEGEDPFEAHLGRSEYFLLTGNPALAVRAALSALQAAGGDLVRAFQCYILLMRCARVQGHHKDALNFAISARVAALEAQRHDMAFRATQAFGELYLSLGCEGERLLRQLEGEYREQGVDLTRYIGPMRELAKGAL